MDKEIEKILAEKDEQIVKLKNVIAGTIWESGVYEQDINGKGRWNINYSSILTRLIHEAGRWCERYASDLFVLWKAVEK